MKAIRKMGVKQEFEICVYFHVSCRLLRLICTCKQHDTFIKMHFVSFQHWAFCQTVQPKDWNQGCSTSEDFMGRLLSKYKSKEDNERRSGREVVRNITWRLFCFGFFILFLIVYPEYWPQYLFTQHQWKYKFTRIAVHQPLEKRTFRNWPFKSYMEEISSNSAHSCS